MKTRVVAPKRGVGMDAKNGCESLGEEDSYKRKANDGGFKNLIIV